VVGGEKSSLLALFVLGDDSPSLEAAKVLMVSTVMTFLHFLITFYFHS
jgi:hypothetical protein